MRLEGMYRWGFYSFICISRLGRDRNVDSISLKLVKNGVGVNMRV